jgi:hypothetical protein
LNIRGKRLSERTIYQGWVYLKGHTPKKLFGVAIFITNFVMNVRIIVGGAETIWFGKSSIPKFYFENNSNSIAT